MNIVAATRSYEAWLGHRLKLLPADLRRKHAVMARSPFGFLRATFYRWCQRWPAECPEEARAPAVLAVGDLHVENFGLWRDAESRLVWGVSDFDEATRLAYTNDLVRLAASVRLARDEEGVALSPREFCAQLLAGYRASLAAGGRPIVLGEHHRWLRQLVIDDARAPAAFWKRLSDLPRWRGAVPPAVRRALDAASPGPLEQARIVHRPAGSGSLGRERYALIGDWRGGKVAREAKALTESAAHWAAGGGAAAGVQYGTILRHAVRCPDPMLALSDGWVVRRLAPDGGRIELSSLPEERDEARLFFEMGWETANVHLGSARAVAAIRRDLARRPEDWLKRASETMADATREDWREWKRRGVA